MSAKKQKVRDAFRTAVFARDKHACVFCGATDKLDAHHITDRSLMPAGGYVVENGITLCDGLDSCHMKAEQWHISAHTTWTTGMHPDELYKRIGSSYEIANEASNRLERRT